jgi:hypothetical protein
MPDNNNESLILRERAEAEEAPLLFFDEELPRIDRTQPKGNYTGERFWRDRPEDYKRLVKLLAEPGISIRSICRELHVTDDTVRAVKERENIAIAAQKRTLLSNITHGARLASERVLEMMPTASAKDALLGVGILTDKMQLLSGEATGRVEEVHRVDLFSDFGDFVKSLERREILPEENKALEMHLHPENNFPKGTAAGSPVIDVEMESVPAQTTDSLTAAVDPAPESSTFDRRARWRARNRERLREDQRRYRKQKATNES